MAKLRFPVIDRCTTELDADEMRDLSRILDSQGVRALPTQVLLYAKARPIDSWSKSSFEINRTDGRQEIRVELSPLNFKISEDTVKHHIGNIFDKVGDPLRTIIVEPLGLPVDQPATEPDSEPQMPEPQEEPVTV